MSRMLWVASGLAVLVAVAFGTLYALPDETSTPAEGGGKAVAFDQALADQGKKVSASNGCTSCHSIDGAKSVGPTWKGTFGTEADVGGKQVPVDAAFIEKAIVDPNAEVRSGYGPSMPSFEGKLSDEEIAAIVEYMKSLSG